MPLAEVILWNKLKGKQVAGYKFRRQYSVEHFVIDFYCPELKLAIEVDGDSHYTEGAALYDRERQNLIENYGIQFLRFANSDIYENLEEVLLKIMQQIKEITPPSPPLIRGGREGGGIKRVK